LSEEGTEKRRRWGSHGRWNNSRLVWVIAQLFLGAIRCNCHSVWARRSGFGMPALEYIDRVTGHVSASLYRMELAWGHSKNMPWSQIWPDMACAVSLLKEIIFFDAIK
jgi:hypothetical protein